MEEITGLNTALGYLRNIKEDKTSQDKFKKGFWSSLNEYPIFFGLVAQYKPENIIECGTCNGASALVFAIALTKLEIDGKIYTWDVAARSRVDENTNLESRIVRHIEPFTSASKTIAKIPGRPLLYFIDGDHSYEGCKADVETIRPFLREGDVVMFHDWHHGPVANAATDAFEGHDFSQNYIIPSKQGIKVVVW